MAVSLTGTTTNVQAKGIYTNLSISLSDGNCSLQKISEKVSVRTHTGEIEVKYDTNRVNPIRKTITVTSNADRPTVALKIKGLVELLPHQQPNLI